MTTEDAQMGRYWPLGYGEPNMQGITPKSPEVKTLREALVKQRAQRIADLDFSDVELRALAFSEEAKQFHGEK